MLRRQYDNELYSRHILLGNQPKVHAIYFGHKTGMSGGGVSPLLMPGSLYTDKRYFRIAKETQYICRTKWYAYDGHTTFYCFMQIRDGKGENQFVPTNEQQTVVAHPELGIDEMKTDTLHVDIEGTFPKIDISPEEAQEKINLALDIFQVYLQRELGTAAIVELSVVPIDILNFYSDDDYVESKIPDKTIIKNNNNENIGNAPQ
jgi:hypothetical protein